RTLLPGTAFLEIMLAARPDASSTVRDVALVAPLALPEEDEVRLQVAVEARGEGGAVVRVYSQPEGEETAWTLHAEGRIAESESTPPAAVVELPPSGATPIDLSEIYALFEAARVSYGASFRGLAEAWRVDDEVWARIALDGAA